MRPLSRQRPLPIRKRFRNIFHLGEVYAAEFSSVWENNLFWPIIIALGSGFAAVYYDHDVKSFADRTVCEQALPGLEEKAKQAKDFMAALSEAAGDKAPNVTYRAACIDKKPEDFVRDLEDLSGKAKEAEI